MEISLRDLPLLTFLDRVRKAIIRSALVVAALAAAAWFVTDRILELLLGLYDGVEALVYVHVAESFMTRLKLAAITGVVAGMPWILWQVYSVVAPLVPKSLRRSGVGLLCSAALLFYAGLLFALYGVLPLALRFFLSFGGDYVEPMIRIDGLVGFAVSFALPFGIIFQLPVVVYFLGRMGLVSAEGLRRYRKYSIFVIFVVAAILTPADVFSQFMMAIPLMVLYELSIILVRTAERRQVRPSED